ncbi:unnamed protein product [Polarella glacialis]|uniref:Uncharacterized protein n=1 Tax=Polarella glacialis TaxID=89957 RepID=A0A813KU50_POLGL|nr:unnamed protein product [Polarella glacialis]
MDCLAQLDAPVLSRLLSNLPQKEALAVAALAAPWPQLAGACVRVLAISSRTPFAPAGAVAAAGGFRRVRELVVDCRSEDPSMCARAAQLLERIHSSCQPPLLERLVVRGLSFEDASQGAELRLFEMVLRLAQGSPALRRLEFEEVHAARPGAPDSALQQLVALLGEASHLPALVELTLCSCQQALRCVRGALFGPLGAQMQRLDLSNNGLGAGGAATVASALPQLLQLQALLLAGNGIGPQGAVFLGQGLVALCGTLRELDLSANGLTAEGLRELVGPCQLLKLRVLKLRGSWIAAEGVEALVLLLQPLGPSLEELDLSQNKLYASSMRALLAGLPEMPKLQWLSLAENTFATADFVAWPPGTSNFGRLAEVAPQLRELDLRDIGLGTSADDFALRAVGAGIPPGLEKLHLSGSKLEAVQLQQLFQVLPPGLRLRVLSLVRCQLDDAGVAMLAVAALGITLPSLDQLRVLDIRANPVSSAASTALLEALRKSPAFRELKVTSLQRSRVQVMK